MNILPYLEAMIKHEASDLYLVTGSPIRLAIHGTVRPMGEEISPEECKNAIHSIMNEEQKRKYEENWELDFSISHKDGRYRINAYMQKGHPAMVVRYVSNDILTLEQLGMPSVMSDLSLKKRGIILMVGATGSGKSTTMAAMVDHRNSNASGHILTIEDPIEYVHNHKKSIVSQREIGTDTKSYRHALRSSLREAPNVILIGEIRDRETMEAAIELSGTGHLCISTLHANNASQALDRIINMFPSDLHKQMFLDLSLNLQAIISQRLVKANNKKRAAAIEILIKTPHIGELIKMGKIDDVKIAHQESKEKGMVTFDDALLDLYKREVISKEEALKNADSRGNLESKIAFG